MINPNPYFSADIQLISNLGFSVIAGVYPIQFLKGDAIKFYAYIKGPSNQALNTSGVTVTMNVGGTDVSGVAVNHATGQWQFDLDSLITSSLEAAVQDVSFVLTRTATSETTFVRVSGAIQPLAVP